MSSLNPTSISQDTCFLYLNKLEFENTCRSNFLDGNTKFVHSEMREICLPRIESVILLSFISAPKTRTRKYFDQVTNELHSSTSTVS